MSGGASADVTAAAGRPGARAPTPVLRVVGLSKTFPGVRALDDVDLDVLPGEVHALVGQNGAGKSTLIKVLAGVQVADAGRVEVDGVAVTIGSPRGATRLGIAVIHQELDLVPRFDVAENMTLGLPQPHRFGLVDRRRSRERVAAVLRELDVDLDPATPVAALSVAQRQMVAIGRALLLDARIVVLDEPTAALGAHEVDAVTALVRRLRTSGRSVVYVSHRLEEVEQLADRVTVMRDGRVVATRVRAALRDRRELVELIVGRAERALVHAGPVTTGEVVLEARGLSWRGRVREVDLALHAGEVTGLAGLVGSGRSELAALLSGAERPESGEVVVRGSRLRGSGPAAGIRAGIALLPEDRRGQAAVSSMTVRENLTLAALDRFAVGPFVSRSRERVAYAAAVRRLGIVAAGPEAPMRSLSGGNQQKVVLAKWLATDARVLLVDEPTQGVDVGAQEEIHRVLRDLAAEGRAVLLISSDLDETVRVSDRVVVLAEGRVVGDLRGAQATVPAVLARCYGT